jgi:hypothetical protein
MKALSKKLNGLVNLTILSLSSLLWQSIQLSVNSQQSSVTPNQSTASSRDERLFTQPQVENEQLLIDSPHIPSPPKKGLERGQEGLGERSVSLPCLDSTTECIEQLTEKAIANSSELVTLDEQIALIDKRLALAGKRIEHTSKKRWTNYISLDPLRIAANVLGGGDVQRDNIAIADLEVKSAELEAYRANLHRRQAEVKSELRDEVLSLVLKYEAAVRQYSLVESQLANHQVQQQIMEIDYRFGNGSTSSYFALIQEGEKLNNQLVQYRNSQLDVVRKIVEITGYEIDVEEVR